MTVIMRLVFACAKLLLMIAWCVHVIVAPDETRMAVFKRGILSGLNVIIPVGGHNLPTSILGARLMWKKAQKNDRKNMISDVMNKIIPSFRLFITTVGWYPWNVASRVTSRHHWIDERSITATASVMEFFVEWNHKIILVVSNSVLKIDVIGHGLCSTMWNEWKFFIGLICFRQVKYG
jgi:hypothetical protein